MKESVQSLITVTSWARWRLNQRRLDCLPKRLFRRTSKKTSKLRVTGLVRGIHRWPVNSPHKGPVTRKMFPFTDVIICHLIVELSWKIWINLLCFVDTNPHVNIWSRDDTIKIPKWKTTLFSLNWTTFVLEFVSFVDTTLRWNGFVYAHKLKNVSHHIQPGFICTHLTYQQVCYLSCHLR